MKVITLKLPEPVDRELQALAERRRTSKSTLIREALDGYLARAILTENGSFLDQARDLAGCVEGPEDLSTSERHLEGCGA